MAWRMRSSSCPASPTNGSPRRSSSLPGASPTRTRLASGLPTPKTRFRRVFSSPQRQQSPRSLRISSRVSGRQAPWVDSGLSPMEQTGKSSIARGLGRAFSPRSRRYSKWLRTACKVSLISFCRFSGILFCSSPWRCIILSGKVVAFMKTFLMPAFLALICLALFPADALAWGIGAHLQVGSWLLDNLHQVPEQLRNLLAAYRHDYLYGCISADITL